MISSDLRRLLNDFYASNALKIPAISTDKILVREGRPLSPTDAHFLVYGLAETREVSEFLERLVEWLERAYEVRKYFRKNAQPNDDDHHRAKANPGGWAGPGLLPIALTIWSLHEDEIRGAFLGCGVFKGGSTAALSHACNVHGIHCLAADTFEGLPYESEDGIYAPGQYRGSLPEVEQHMAACGVPDVVEYIQGLFGDTLGGVEHDVSIAFLDTDLYESSISALRALGGKLVEDAVIFSDGVPAAQFGSGEFDPVRGEALALRDFANETGLQLSGTHTGFGGNAVFTFSKTKGRLVYSRSFVKALYCYAVSRLLGFKDRESYKQAFAEAEREPFHVPVYDPAIEYAADTLMSASYRFRG